MKPRVPVFEMGATKKRACAITARLIQGTVALKRPSYSDSLTGINTKRDPSVGPCGRSPPSVGSIYP